MYAEEPFVSFAQNFEDVILWRALRNCTPGFYIDVGANDPIDTSVTKAFYQRGWRGINIEPVKEYFEALCKDRPEDINLNTFVGDEIGDVEFYEFPFTGFSTADSELLEYHASRGKGYVTRRIPAYPLSDICEKHVKGEIHFLKIDVEGFEGKVLKSMDFQKWRPWVLVIESPYDREPEWKSFVLEQGYDYVYFDGLNGFYVAKEHADLKNNFVLPPNDVDNFELREGHRRARLSHDKIDELSMMVEDLTRDRDELAVRVDRAEEQLKRLLKSRGVRAISFVKRVLRF